MWYYILVKRETDTQSKRIEKTETKNLKKISKKVLTNSTKYGIISMSGERNRNQAKASLETETKKTLDKQNKIWYNDYTKRKERI